MISEEYSAKKIDVRSIPPRVRAYCKQHNIDEDIMVNIPVSNTILTIEDVEKFLAQQSSSRPSDILLSDDFAARRDGAKPIDNRRALSNDACKIISKEYMRYKEMCFSAQQQALNLHFKRSADLVIPATLVSVINIENIKSYLYSMLSHEITAYSFISEFQLFAYLITGILMEHPKFRSRIIDNKKFYEYENLNLGIAVQTKKHELVTAVIPDANQLSIDEFITTMRHKIDLARNGNDQAASIIPHVIISYMGSGSVIFGSPVLVSPTIATLFLGGPIDKARQGISYLSLTFDHRLINGMDAQNFLQSVNQKLEKISLQSSCPQNINYFSTPNTTTDNHNVVNNFKSWFIETISLLLNVKTNEIDLNESLGMQGLDSIKAVELASNLSTYFKVDIPPTIVWHYPNFNSLVQHLTERFNLSKNDNEVENNIDKIFDNLKNLSPSEIDALFKEIGFKNE
ncbi:2-oxo acid dehydrogenase subunit E2 [Candidatus Tisiphia endosymbiont of Nemotelus uliginosus]|uniref:2-oxo acid dehydrogenase subunit E2 n=1 Tax=Candidatus Tisiphia endosymbiont of Nemotelus uliginosus TaxID=3077926 RepID=UPI0035C89FB4